MARIVALPTVRPSLRSAFFAFAEERQILVWFSCLVAIHAHLQVVGE
jgi:hypothetical protein